METKIGHLYGSRSGYVCQLVSDSVMVNGEECVEYTTLTSLLPDPIRRRWTKNKAEFKKLFRPFESYCKPVQDSLGWNQNFPPTGTWLYILKSDNVIKVIRPDIFVKKDMPVLYYTPEGEEIEGRYPWKYV